MINWSNTDHAILVLSCDRYSDMWDPFFRLFSKYWKDPSCAVYLGNNTAPFTYDGVQVLHSGPPENWTTDTQKILEQIKEKYVILLLEDYFLMNAVNRNMIAECVELVRKEDALFMRLACFPKDHFSDYAYDIIPGKPWCGITRDSAPYRINLQAGIWNVKGLIGLLNDQEDPWMFELEGSKRSARMRSKCLGLVEDPRKRYVHGPIPYLCTALSRGVWMRDALFLLKKEGIAVPVTRPVESWWAFRKRRLYHSLPFGLRPYLDFLSSRLNRRKE